MISENTERKLQIFADTIQQEIDAKRIQVKLEAEIKHKVYTGKNLELAAKRIDLISQSKQEEITRNANRQISQAKVRAMAKYVQYREEQIDRLFIDVKAKLAAFTQEAEYEAYLIQKIKKAALIGGFFAVELSPHDMRFENIINSSTGLISEAGSDFIGGFILYNKKRNLRVDYSFKTKLQIAQKEFRYDL